MSTPAEDCPALLAKRRDDLAKRVVDFYQARCDKEDVAGNVVPPPTTFACFEISSDSYLEDKGAGLLCFYEGKFLVTKQRYVGTTGHGASMSVIEAGIVTARKVGTVAGPDEVYGQNVEYTYVFDRKADLDALIAMAAK